MKNVIVTGGSSGLGAAIMRALHSTHYCMNFDRNVAEWMDVRTVTKAQMDAVLLPEEKVDILINCAGVNKIGWIEDFNEQEWNDVMDINAKGIFMMTKAVLPRLVASRGTILNIVSNASHMPMTCSTAYNASKGAAHIMTQQMARELTRKYGITVFGISPNKLHGTGMSSDIERQVCKTRGWTEQQANQYQLASLLAGEETDVQTLADFIAYLLGNKQRHKFLTGCVIPYGA